MAGCSTSSCGTGASLLGLKASGNEVRAQDLLHRDMKNHHGGVVLVNGHIYGYNDSILTCLSSTAARWSGAIGWGRAVTYADGHLYILSETTSSAWSRRRLPVIAKGGFNIADQGWPSWAIRS